VRRDAPTSAATVGSLIEKLLLFALLLAADDAVAAAAVEEERRVSDRPNDNDFEDDGLIAWRAERRAEIGNNISILSYEKVSP